VRGDNPYAAQRACDALQAMVAQPGWNETFTAYARCARITRNLDSHLSLNPAAYTEPVEQALHDAYLKANDQMADQAEPAVLLGAILQDLQAPINAYFEQVLVNATDETLRQARLALVQQVARLPAACADLSKLQGF
jgi:glycyl-tRNA synthetase beta subunit